jgi:glyoxylase-like metal-dependent hydrolase (beta-lactamase superfamily II)
MLHKGVCFNNESDSKRRAASLLRQVFQVWFNKIRRFMMSDFSNRFQRGISRREWLKGAGLATAGLAWGLPYRFVQAQGEAASAPMSTYQFSVGKMEVTVIRDAGGPFLPASLFGSNAEESERNAFFAAHGMQVVGDNLNVVIQNILVKNGDQYVLFDTGNGAAGGGVLAATLARLGVQPEQINTVLLSHYHPDHINGLTDAENKLAFPNAQVMMPQVEYDFLQTVGEGTPISEIVQAANAKLGAALASDHVVFYDDEDEVVPGVQAVHTPGHTPGHMSYLLSSEGSQLLAVVDSAINAYVGLERPEWHFGFDSDPAQAVDTRKQILGRASDEQLLVFGYHFPFPGIGYVARQGDADEWRWLPSAT